VTRSSIVRAGGVDGPLVLDSPIEEPDSVRDAIARDMDMRSFLLSPTTTDERIMRPDPGAFHGISRLGVTGARYRRRRRGSAGEAPACGYLTADRPRLRQTPDHVRQIGAFADAAVVGSGLVAVIAEAGKDPDLIDRVESYVRWLKGEPAKEPT
jgi:tryptophan synthase alpha chain